MRELSNKFVKLFTMPNHNHNPQDFSLLMKDAISLARTARPSPNPRVGAIIIDKNGKVIGKGFHEKPGQPHAEINAILNAKKKLGKSKSLKGCTLICTLEPCCTFGRTPPCTDAIIREGISHVVIGTKDPNPKVCGKGMLKLIENNIKITEGILSKDAEAMNEGYNYFINHKKPFIILKAAVSLDGKIASEKKDSKWISNEKSRKIVHFLRSKYDAILVGSGTVLNDNPKLTSRIKNGINPLRIIIDSRLSISLNANVLNDKNVIIFTTSSCSKKKKELLEKKCIDVVVAESNAAGSKKEGKNESKKEVDLKKVIIHLSKIGVTSILVEGGSKIYNSFLKQKLVNKIVLFFAPIILGGKNSPSLLDEGFSTVKKSIKLHNYTFTQIDDNIMLEGFFKK